MSVEIERKKEKIIEQSKVKQKEEEQKRSAKSGERFKFSITLIVFSFTILYNLYFYVENNPLNNVELYIIWILSCFTLIAFICTCTSLFFSALSFGVNDSDDILYLETGANKFYLAGFYIMFSNLTLIPTLIVCLIIYETIISIAIFFRISENYFLSLATGFIFLFITYLIYRFVFKRFINSKRLTKTIESIVVEPLNRLIKICTNSNETKITSVFLFSIAFAGVAFFFINCPTLIEVNDTISKQNEQVLIEIKMMGAQSYDNGIYLSKVNSENNLTLLDSIEVFDYFKKDKIITSKYLICQKEDIGKYKLFLNCSNLEKGCYMLTVNVPQSLFDEKKNKIFFLI